MAPACQAIGRMKWSMKTGDIVQERLQSLRWTPKTRQLVKVEPCP